MEHKKGKHSAAKETKNDIAYHAIRDRILSNDLKPLDCLAEAKLCEELKLSRTPVRSALQRLAYDGLVKYVPGKGMTVAQFTLTELLEVAEVRIPNESIAAGLAAERMADADIEALERCVEATEEAARSQLSEKCFELDDQFHILIANGTKNSRVVQIVTELVEVSGWGTFLSKKDYDRMLVAAKQHRQVYEAIRMRDKELAQQRMHEHLNDWIEYTKQQVMDNFYLYR